MAWNTLVPTGRNTNQPSPGAVFRILVTMVGYMPFSWQLGSPWPPTFYPETFSTVSSVAHRKKMLSLLLLSRRVSEG